MQDNGIIIVGSRIKSWLKKNWNRDEYILLPSQHAFTKLYIQYLHNRDHSGVEGTLANCKPKIGCREQGKSLRLLRLSVQCVEK